MLCILSAPPSRCPTSHRSNRAELRWTDALLAMLFAPCSSITTLCASAGSWHGEAWSSLPLRFPILNTCFLYRTVRAIDWLQLQDDQDMHWVQPTYSLFMTTRLYSLKSPVQPRAELAASLPPSFGSDSSLNIPRCFSVSILLMSNYSYPNDLEEFFLLSFGLFSARCRPSPSSRALEGKASR